MNEVAGGFIAGAKIHSGWVSAAEEHSDINGDTFTYPPLDWDSRLGANYCHFHVVVTMLRSAGVSSMTATIAYSPHGLMTNANVVDPPCGIDMIVEFRNSQGGIPYRYPILPLRTIECTPPVQPDFWKSNIDYDAYDATLEVGILIPGDRYWSNCVVDDSSPEVVR
jgi:hypothetical protein